MPPSTMRVNLIRGKPSCQVVENMNIEKKNIRNILTELLSDELKKANEHLAEVLIQSSTVISLPKNRVIALLFYFLLLAAIAVNDVQSSTAA